MRAACHDPAFAKRMKISKNVACDFARADKKIRRRGAVSKKR